MKSDLQAAATVGFLFLSVWLFSIEAPSFLRWSVMLAGFGVAIAMTKKSDIHPDHPGKVRPRDSTLKIIMNLAGIVIVVFFIGAPILLGQAEWSILGLAVALGVYKLVNRTHQGKLPALDS